MEILGVIFVALGFLLKGEGNQTVDSRTECRDFPQTSPLSLLKLTVIVFQEKKKPLDRLRNQLVLNREEGERHPQILVKFKRKCVT